jgi:transcriptional regulator with XRE-family HTH domain
MISAHTAHRDAETLSANLRRLMARDGLTFDDVVQASGLDERTVRAVARGQNHPHARTVHKLARGLGETVEELFRPAGRWSLRRFDRATNSLVESVVAANASLFESWCEADFDELYSRFGTGGQLTDSGVLAAAKAMNAKRDVLRQASVILESSESQLLADFVELLYRRATNARPSTNGEPRSGNSP